MKTSRGPLRFLDRTSATLLIMMLLIGAVVGAYQWERNRKVPFDSARWIERPDKRYQMLDALTVKLNSMKKDPQALATCMAMLGAEKNPFQGPAENEDWAYIRQTIEPNSGGPFLRSDRYVKLYFKDGCYFGHDFSMD